MTSDDREAAFMRLLASTHKDDKPNVTLVFAATVDLWGHEPLACVAAQRVIIDYFRMRGLLPSPEACAQALPTGNTKVN